MNPTQEQLILTVAYGDGNWLDRQQVDRLIRKDSEAKAFYEECMELADASQQIQLPPAPTDLVNQLKAIPDHQLQLSAEPERSRIVPFSFAGMAAAAALILFLFFVATGTYTQAPNQSGTPGNPIYSQQDIADAEFKAKLAFALIRRELHRSTEIPITIVNEEMQTIIPDSLNRISNPT